jgi:hypothetical protein
MTTRAARYRSIAISLRKLRLTESRARKAKWASISAQQKSRWSPNKFRRLLLLATWLRTAGWPARCCRRPQKTARVSPAIEKQLNDLGIFHYSQIAELNEKAAHNVGEEVGLPGACRVGSPRPRN